MDRRTTIATLIGKNRASAASRQTNTVAPVPRPPGNAGLEPYSGPWSYEQAAHLLRRAMFGPTHRQITQGVEQGLEGLLDQLFAELPLPAPPINYSFRTDPFVPVGATWVDAPYSREVNLNGYRNQSLRAWTYGLIMEEGISLRENLTLFWHNHFAVSEINDPKFWYRHVSLLRTHAWGNFRELMKEMTIDPAMLRFLNGNQNTSQAPNENYARELLELYTLGKGEPAGPGDYTTFTEDDVVQIARVLTGWFDVGYNTINPNVQVGSAYRTARHDRGDKQLSHRFNQVVISNLEEREYAHLIDIIFERKEAARFICRKLYRWFVYYHVDEEIERNVIEPMAEILIASDYELQPALRALLGSEHFFDVLNQGPMIKNPIQFIFSALKQTEISLPDDLIRRYTIWFQLFRGTTAQQMEYFNPPNVAGWKAYYQEPLYYRTWINATTLPLRMEFAGTLATTGFRIQGFPVQIDVLRYIAGIERATDPNNLIEELTRRFLPRPLTEGQKTALKEVLIPGLPDFEWTVEYGQYLADPENSNLAAAVETKLRLLFRTLLNLPEFFLS